MMVQCTENRVTKMKITLDKALSELTEEELKEYEEIIELWITYGGD